MPNRPSFLFPLLLSACFPRLDAPAGDPRPDRDGVSDDPDGSGDGPDGSDDQEPAANPYESYQGEEINLYASEVGGAWFDVCEIRYEVSGERVGQLCEGCSFVFDVRYTYDEANSQNLLCAAELDGVSYKLAYSEDWEGNGPYALVEYGGEFYGMAPASFNPSSGAFRYAAEQEGTFNGLPLVITYEGEASVE